MRLSGLFSKGKSARLLAEAQRLFHEGAAAEAEKACAACAEAAIAERASDPKLHTGLAEILEKLGQYGRAAEQYALALDALPAADPGRPRAMLRLAASLHDCNKAAEAVLWYRKILEIDPANGAALLCLAVIREDADAAEARGLMDRYVAVDPGVAGRLRRALMLPVIFQSVEEIDSIRARLDRDLDEILSQRFPQIEHPEFEVGSTPFNLAYHGRNNAGPLRKIAQACRSVYAGRTECGRRLRASGGPLRVGFVSTFFQAHPVGRTTHGLIRDLPRDDFRVDVFAITPQADEMAETIRKSADHYVALPRDLGKVREAIESAALDILFFADIGMDPLTYFLAFWRLAPIQMVTWGHSVTSGIDTVDCYVSSDAIEAPGSEQYYTEKLVRLPGYFMPRYRRPLLDGPRKSRGELGLPEGKRVYYCPQSLFKLHPDFDPAIRAILERDPEAEVLLLEFLRAGVQDLVSKRFARTLGPLASRVHFLPRMDQRDYLQYLCAADVILDPFHFGGCNSSCEALSLGVPVVTLPGAQLPGRFTLGLYKEMGIESCIADSPEEFVDIAIKLGRDKDYRRSVSEQISARCELLFDRPDTGLILGRELLRIADTAATGR